MWSLLYNGHTIALPNSDDFYTVITDTTKMFTTNVDLPITQDLINIFNIRGLLTKENGMFFKKVELPATLQGFGVKIPCKISIESIKQKEGLLNLFLSAKSTIGYSPTEIGQTFEDIWENYHYPLIRRLELPHFWGGLTAPKFYTDNSNYTENTNIATNLPYITNSQLNTLLQRIGYSNISVPAFGIYPNQIYMSGKYKMRRVFAQTGISDIGWGSGVLYPDNWDIDIAKVYKGDYAGLSQDEVKSVFYVERPIVKHRLSNTFVIREATRKIIIFLTGRKQLNLGDGADYGDNFEIQSSAPFSRHAEITGTTLDADSVLSNGAYTDSFSTIILSTSALHNNFVVIEGDFSAGTKISLSWTLWSENYGLEHNHSFRHVQYLQYFFDDDYDGVIREEGDLTDEQYTSETYQTSAYFEVTSKHFNSMGFSAMGHNDYNTDAGDDPDTTFTSFVPPTFLLNLRTSNNIPVWRNFYNGSPALMWVNTLDCFEGISIYDILSRMTASRNQHLNVNAFSWSVDGSNDINAATIDNYILYDELVFDDTYGSKKTQFANQDVENADVTLLQNTLVNMTAVRVRGTNATDTDIIASNTIFGIKNYDNSVTTDYSQAKSLFTPMKQYYLNDDHCYLATFNSNAKGFALIRYDETTDWNLEYQETIFTDTTLSVGQIVNVHIMGYIPTQYVVFQTRTFKVLEQEIGADGVNSLKLLLYK